MTMYRERGTRRRMILSGLDLEVRSLLLETIAPIVGRDGQLARHLTLEFRHAI